MNALFALALLLTQAHAPKSIPAPAPPAPTTKTPAPAQTPPSPPPKPWRGTLAQGLAEVRRLSEADKTDDALAVAEQLLAPNGFAQWRERATGNPGWKKTVVEAAGPVFEAVGLSDLTPAERASVHFARGVALARAEKRAESDEAFEKARALAGPGDLRLDATYDLGWTALEEGEKQRAKIPELNGGAAAAPPAAASPAGPDPTAPDPLDLARAAYQKARERFVEGLKANARDEDSRANVELAQKRLKELAEIQKKREEEKKKQDQQKQDDQKKDQDKKDQDKKDKDKQDKDKQDKDKQDPQKKDSSSDDKDKKKPDEQPKDDKPKDDQSKKDQPNDESDRDKQEKKAAQPQASKEQQLTKEEVMRLLDTLKDREEEGKKLLEQLRRARRAKVKKDW